MLGLAATLWLGFLVNWMSALLALTANVFYVFVYTMILKRRTSQNIVWGGIAGCFPPLIGWTAVTGSIALAPFILFAVVFFWTPPHTWALALRYREDYASAGVPMLPVVREPPEVARQILVYSVVTVAVSLALWPIAPTGWLYPLVAVVAGAALIWESIGAAAPGQRRAAGRRPEADAAVPLVELLPGAAVRGRRRRPAALLSRRSSEGSWPSRSSCCWTRTPRHSSVRSGWRCTKQVYPASTARSTRAPTVRTSPSSPVPRCPNPSPSWRRWSLTLPGCR